MSINQKYKRKVIDGDWQKVADIIGDGVTVAACKMAWQRKSGKYYPFVKAAFIRLKKERAEKLKSIKA